MPYHHQPRLADVKKEGHSLDLSIAIGLVAAS